MLSLNIYVIIKGFTLQEKQKSYFKNIFQESKILDEPFL